LHQRVDPFGQPQGGALGAVQGQLVAPV
jgi:hypothetical protein